MQYMGGKAKVSKDISLILNKFANNNVYFVSLFCGSCAIESRIEGFKKKILNDNHKYLIEMWKAVQNGWIPPISVSNDEYVLVKNTMEADTPLTGFIGFCCSFGGKWFGGYAKNKRGDNFAKQGHNGIMKKRNGLTNETTIFLNRDYREVNIPKGSVIYCDPPYKGTTKYKTGDFGYEEYYDYIRKLSKENMVFCSEYSMPDDFVPVWEKLKKVTLEQGDNKSRVRTEKLFIHKSLYNTYYVVIK